MKKIAAAMVMVLFLGAFAAGANAVKISEKGNEVTSEDVKRESKEAASTTGAYIGEKRDQYVARMEREYSDLGQRIDNLKAKSAEFGSEAKAQVNEQIERLEAQKDAVGSRLSELRASSGRAWEDMKEGLDNAMGDLKRSYERASSNFS